MLVDVHIHLEQEQYTDLDEVIKRAKQAKVAAIIHNGISMKSNQFGLDLAEKYSIVKPALGLHPEDALKMSNDQIDEELRFIEKNIGKAIAVGEIGLDDHWIKNRLEEQKTLLERLMKIAKRHNKPVEVHTRDAEQDSVDMLESLGYKKVLMHCFGGNKKLTKRIIDNGWYMSIPCTIVYDQHFQRIATDIPMSHMLTETDGPFLAPVKGERNEPANIVQSIRKIAEIKKMTPEETTQIIFNNYQRLFL